MDVPVVVLTHNPPGPDNDSFVFVTEGIEAAIAKARELAGDKNVGLNSGQIADSGARGQADRRGLDRPRPGPAGRRHAVLQPSSTAPLSSGPAVDRRRQGRHTPAVSRALRVIDSSARARASSEPGARAVDDDPQVRAGDGQLVAVEAATRPISGWSIVLRSEMWRATRPLLPQLGEARAGRPAGRRSARAAARRPGSGRRRRAGRRRPRSPSARPARACAITRRRLAGEVAAQDVALVVAEQRACPGRSSRRSARPGRRPSPARRAAGRARAGRPA